MTALSALAQQLFQIRPEEVRRTALCFVYLFFCIGAFIIARIARTVLFLEIPGYKEQLPLTYIAIAVIVSLAMAGYARVERTLRRDHTNIITFAALAAVTLGFRVALRPGALGVYWAFYIWVEVFGSFLIVQFWSFANEIFHARQAKRLFAVIGGWSVVIVIEYLAGYLGGIAGVLISRVPDPLLAFPGILLAILLIALLGPGLISLSIAIAIFRFRRASVWKRCAENALLGRKPQKS